MDIKDWRYYNHAVIPVIPPHEKPDTTPINNGQIWKIDGKRPLLARWTTNFDCGYETNWWYIIKDTPFNIDELSKSARNHIRQALKKCTVKKICIQKNISDLFRVYAEAHTKYKNADNKCAYAEFKQKCINDEIQGIEYWGGFKADTNCLIGYMTVCVYTDYCEIQTAKFSPEYLNLRISDALYTTVLSYYLNDKKKKYISSGSRNINHTTNTQEYKIKTFGYRKAYCHLHIEYNPKIKWIIKILFRVRKFLKLFDNITLFHQINSILQMEEIFRGQGLKNE